VVLGRVNNGVPAWRCLSKIIFPNSDIGSKGAWHGIEIGYVFGTQEFLSKKVRIMYSLLLTVNITSHLSAVDTPDAAKFTKEMMTAWATFAKEPKDGMNQARLANL